MWAQHTPTRSLCQDLFVENQHDDRERRKPAVGMQIKRWRAERGLTLANVAERSGLNVGYLSQIENDKASPSLQCLASIADALEVPTAWFLVDDLPAPASSGPRTGP